MLTPYQLGKTLSEDAHVSLMRAHRRADNVAVLLRVFHAASDAEALSRLRREHDLQASLQHPAIPQVYDLQRHDRRWVLEMEHFPGDPLDIGIKRSVDDVLHIALQVAEVLEFVHGRGIIHKSVRPQHVLQSAQGTIKLLDFSLASALQTDASAYSELQGLDGAVEYVSPEQTGRTNRSVDARSDLYALGAMLYALLTGHPPFEASDPIEVVHALLAKVPASPQTLRPELPLALDGLILKLLAKDPEQRYQTAHGVHADLQAIRTALSAGDASPSITLALHDVADALRIPKTLYGREGDVQALLTSFDATVAGQARWVLLSGPAGIGKSSLVQELYKPLTVHRGYFVSGKFDAVQRGTPYQVAIEAMRQLVAHLLTADREAIEAWRAKATAAVSPDGRVILEVVPEAKHLLAEQPPLAELSGAGQKARFERVFWRFVCVFADAQHPLVMFLDDMQWTDRGTIDLLRALRQSQEQAHVFVIASFRDNEVSAGHLFGRFMEEQRAVSPPMQHLQLGPLREVDVAAYLQDMLQASQDVVAPLASVALEKTAGNPFFLAEYFKALVAESLLRFDAQERVWRWDIAQVRRSASTSNMATLLADKITRLSEAARKLLQLSAVVGNRFELCWLAHITQHSDHATARALQEAVANSIVVPLTDLHELCALDPDAQGMHVVYKFAHDRVQQQVYQGIDEAARAALHYQAAKTLHALGGEAQEFSVVGHYHAGRSLLHGDDERAAVAVLCLQAGKRAADASAYAQALTYYRNGIEILGDAWQRKDVATPLHLGAARMAMLCGEYALLDTWVTAVEQHVTRPEDIATAWECTMLAQSGQGNIHQALATGGKILRLLGRPVVANPSTADVLRELAATMWMLRGEPPEKLLDYPVMTDERALIVARCCAQMSSAAYYASSNLSVVLVFLQVRTAHQFGNGPWSPFSWAIYGTVFSAYLKKYDLGYRYVSLAAKLADKLGAAAQRGRVSVQLYGFVSIWLKPVGECAQGLLDTYQDCVDVGDSEYACHALYISSYNRFFAGTELGSLATQLQADADSIRRLKQERSLISLGIWRQGVHNLRGLGEGDPWHLRGEYYDETNMLPLFSETKNVHGLANTYVMRLMLAYWFERFDEAIENARGAAANLHVFRGVSVPSWYHFYAALSCLRAAQLATGSRRRACLARAQKSLKALTRWGRDAPVNHTAKMLIAQGLAAHTAGQFDRAERLLERGIADAQKMRLVSEEAVGLELLARLHGERGRPQTHAYYLQQAHAAFGHWGAAAKVTALEVAYPEILHAGASAALASRPAAMAGGLQGLDMESVLRTSQDLSGIIDLRVLSARLMNHVMENAGAQRGALLLTHPTHWILAIDSRAGETAAATLAPLTATEAREAFPVDMLHYVQRATQTVVLPGPRASLFASDPYMQQHHPLSVLCLPLTHQGTVNAVLYLENNLAADTFTERRIALLQLLSSQLSLAIDNARLYTNLEVQVAERTRELQESQAKVLALQKTQLENQMAGGFAHEMRNALNAASTLIGALYLPRPVWENSGETLEQLHDIVQAGLPEAALQEANQAFSRLVENQELVDEALVGIKDATERAQRITTEILNYAQLGRLQPGDEDVSLTQVLQAVERDFHVRRPGEAPGAHAIALHMDATHGALRIPMSESHLYTLLRNLIANARDAVEDAHKPNSSVTVRVQPTPERVVLRIIDNGGGIPQSVQKRLFEPFFTTKGTRGTGLGLGIVKRITELYDLPFQYETSLGNGTEFSVTLPLKSS